MRKVIIDEGVFYTRTAVLNNENIETVDYLFKDDTPKLNEIYIAKITKINKSNKSAYLELPNKNLGYIEYKENKNVGDIILVQVVKEGYGKKYATLSDNLKLKGKYTVLLPNEKVIKFSKKISDQKKYEKIIASLPVLNCGLLFRTQSENASDEELKKEIQSLSETYKEYLRLEKISNSTKILHSSEEDIIEEIIYSEEKNIEIIINNKTRKKYLETLGYNNIILKDTNLFSIYGISKDYMLKTNYEYEGIELVIEKTEAMTVIDINSKAKETSYNKDENNYNINKKICSKIVDIIILKNISGIIVVDFISMKNNEYNKKLIEHLKEAFKKDYRKVKILDVTPLGLVQIAREKKSMDIYDRFTEKCSYCNGTGFIINDKYKKIEIEEKIQLNGYDKKYLDEKLLTLDEIKKLEEKYNI